MTKEQQDMLDEITALRTKNAALEAAAKATANSPLTIRKSPKGGVMVMGLGQYPVTLYQEQWKRLLAVKESILTFIDANKADLKVKGQAEAETPAATVVTPPAV